MFNLKCNKKYICNKLLYEKKVKWKHLIQGKLKNVEKNIIKHMVLKLCSSDWDLNPWTSSWHHTSDFKTSSSFFSQSVMSNSLWPYGLQHARLPIPSPSPGICSNQCPLSQWCHPTISSSAAPFSSCPQSFPASRSFLMSWLLASGGQSIGASASASVLPMNIHNWFFQDWLVWFTSCPRGSQESSPTPQFKKHQFSTLFMVQLSHQYMTTGKTIALIYGPIYGRTYIWQSNVSAF